MSIKSVKSIFFSDNNVDRLAKYLRNKLNLDNSKRAFLACKELMLSQMKLIYEKNKEKLINVHPDSVIPKLNEKSVAQCMKVYAERTKTNKRPQVQPVNKVSKVTKPKEEPAGLASGMDGGDFAPFLTDSGEFIAADGTVGSKMFFGNMNDQLGLGDKRSNNDEIEKRMLLRQADYDNFKGNGQQPNKQPDHLNFALDGSDSRQNLNGSMKAGTAALPNFDNEYDIMGLGMGNMDGMGNMGNMANMGMPNMNMGNMGMPNMNMGNMGMPNMNMGNMGMQQNGLPNMNMGMPNMGMQQNGMPNMGMNNMGMPNMGMNNMGMPNMGMSNMGMSNMGMQQNGMSNMGMQQNGMSNMSMGNTGMPNMGMSNMNIPQTSMPNRNSMQLGSTNCVEPNYDIEKKIADLQTERERQRTFTQEPKNELKELINSKKKEIARKVGFNPETILNMTPEQIDEMLTKPKKEQKEPDNIEARKRQLLDMLLKKTEAKKKQDDAMLAENIESTAPPNAASDVKRTTVKPKSAQYSNVKTEITDMAIKADEFTTAEFYNNYVVDIDPQIKNTVEIKIDACDFPVLRPIVDEAHNTFTIIYKGERWPICLDNGDNYKLAEIIGGINSALEAEGIPIVIRENRNKIELKHKNDEQFELDLTGPSIGVYLGFTKDEYADNSFYTSEKCHMFSEQSYFMFLPELSEEAICEIQSNGIVNQLITKLKKPINISKLTIQYRINNNNKSEFVNFYESGHEFKLIFTSKHAVPT